MCVNVHHPLTPFSFHPLYVPMWADHVISIRIIVLRFSPTTTPCALNESLVWTCESYEPCLLSINKLNQISERVINIAQNMNKYTSCIMLAYFALNNIIIQFLCSLYIAFGYGKSERVRCSYIWYGHGNLCWWTYNAWSNIGMVQIFTDHIDSHIVIIKIYADLTARFIYGERMSQKNAHYSIHS